MNKYLPLIALLFLHYLPLTAQTDQPDGDPVQAQKQGFLLPPQLNRLGELTTLSAGDDVEGDFISDMQFTPDGSQVWVVNRATNNITVFDWETQSIETNIQTGNLPFGIALTEQYAVVSCYADNLVYIYDVNDYSQVALIPVSNQPAKVKVSRDGALAVVGCDDPDAAEVIDLTTLEKVLTVEAFPIEVTKFSFITSNTRSSLYWNDFVITPDNAYLVNASPNSGMRFYDLSTGDIVKEIPEAGDCDLIALSGDGTMVVAAQTGSDPTAFQVSLDSQALVTQVAIPGLSISTAYSEAAVNMDGSKMLVPSITSNTILIDFETGTFQEVATGNMPDWVGQSADYEYAIAGDFYLVIIDFETGQPVGGLNGISIQNGAVSGANNRIVATDPLRYESLNFYEFEDPTTLNLLFELPSGSLLEGDGTYSTKFTPDGKRLVLVNSLSGTLTIVDVELEVAEAIVPLGSTETFHVDVTPDNRYALVAKRLENLVSVVDLETGEKVADVPSGGQKPDQVFVLPGGEYAYAINAGSGDRIGVIKIDGANSALETTFSIGNVGISWTNYGIRSDLVFHPTEPYALLAAPFDNAVQVIDLNNHTVASTIVMGEFPLQMDIVADEDFGAFVGVTLKNEGKIALVAFTGPTAQLVGTYEVGNNPTCIAYDPVLHRFVVCDNDNAALNAFDIDGLTVEPEESFSNHTPIASRYSAGGRNFLLLRSADEMAYEHLLRVDDIEYALPSLPVHYFSISADGNMAAIPLITADAVTILKEEPLGTRQALISLSRRMFDVFPNPSTDIISFRYKGENVQPGDWTFELFDATGMLLLQMQKNAPDVFEIGRKEEWPSGFYFYKIAFKGKQVQSGKVVFE